MLRKVCVFVLWMMVTVGSYAQTKSPGTYRSSTQDGAALSPINFTVSKITGDTLVCVGDVKSWQIKVTGTSVYAYKWVKMNAPSLSLSDTSVLKIDGIQQSHASKYYCEVTDLMSGVKKYSDTIDLKVVIKPTVSIASTADTVAAGEPVKLTASGAEKYQWSTGASTDTMTVRPRQTMIYTVTGTNGGVCTDTETKTVHVVQMVLDLGPDIYITQGTSVQLTARTNLSQITWKRLVPGGSPVNIGTGLSITQTPAVTTEYEAEGEFKGAKVSARVKVIVRSSDSYRSGPQDGYAESAIYFDPGTITGETVICEGGSTTFTIKTKGTSVYSYQWKKRGTPPVSLGSDTTTLTLINLTVADTGYYYCEVTDLRNDSMKMAEPVHLKVVPYPEAHIGSPADGIIICYGDSIVLDARDSEVGRPTGATYKYSWTGVSGKSDTSVVTTVPSATQNYVVSVSNEQCTTYDTVRVVVYRPQVDLPFDYYTTEGAMTDIRATTSDTVNLDWYVGQDLIRSQTSILPFVYGPVVDEFTVYARMNKNGCMAEDSCRVLVKSGGGYKSGKQDGYAQSCLHPRIIDQSSGDIAGCAEDSVMLFVDAEGSGLSYTWKKMVDHQFEVFVPSAGSHVSGLGTAVLKFNPPVVEDEGLYICEVSNECGEQVSDTFGVSVGGRPVLITKLNRDWEQCLYGKPAELAVYVASLNNKELTYKWYKDGVLLTGEEYDGAGITVGMESESAEGLYKVEVTNECGTITDSTFLPVDVPAYVLSNDTVIHVCENGTAEFRVEIGGGGTYTSSLKKVVFSSSSPLGYELQDIGRTGQHVLLPDMDKSHDGEYYAWVVENHCGGDTSHLIRVVIEEKPEIEMIGSDTTLCAGESLTLQVKLTAGTGTMNYVWYRNGEKTVYTGPVLKKVMRVEDAGLYTCHVDNSYCLPPVVSDSRNVTVHDKASISLKGIYVESDVINSEGKYCEGTDLKLKADVLTTQAVDSMRWYLNGVPVKDDAVRINGSTTATLAMDSVTPAEAGVYTLHLYNECGENIQGNFRLTVPQPARFVLNEGNLVDMTLCQGVNQAISVQTTGTAPIRFTWTHSGRIIADGYSNTLQLKDVTVDTAGVYCCEIHNGCNPAQRKCAEIRVTHPDTFRLEGSGRYCMNADSGVVITLNGSDTSTLYRLYRNDVVVAMIHGKDVRPAGNPVVFKNNLAGSYYVTGEDDEDHCEFRMPGNVTIQGDIAPVVYDLKLTKSFCRGSRGAELTLSGSEDNADIIYTLYKVTPTRDEVVSAGRPGTGDTLVWSGLQEGDYKVVAENRISGCRETMKGLVNVSGRELPVLPVLKPAGDTVYCAGTASYVKLQVEQPEANTSYLLLNNHQRPGSITTQPEWNNLKAGYYSVYAVNQWGCESGESNTVQVKEQTVARPVLTGNDIYCEGDTSLHRIEINGLRNDLDYVIYEESPVDTFGRFSGVSGRLTIDVPSEEKIYYVQATDRTPLHCSVLSDTVEIRKSKFTISVVSPMTIANGEQATLHVNITGASSPVIEWQPAAKISGANNEATVQTVPLQSGESFTVTVKEGGCEQRALINVIVTGTPLKVDIRLEDQLTSVDTIRLCTTDSLNLFGWYDGGTGDYTAKWYENGQEIAVGQWLRNYRKDTDGYLHYAVTSGGITEKDSVYIQLLPVPERPGLADTGLQCVAGNDYILRLPSTENGVYYVLEYDRTGSGIYQELTATQQVGTGNPLTFTVANIAGLTGYYRLKAVKTNAYGECAVHSSVQEVRVGPKAYTVSESETYCRGEKEQDTIYLSGSQSGVSYWVERRPNLPLLPVLQGVDTEPQLFTGNYGTGTYVVKAKLGDCETEMEDSVVINVKNSPADRPLFGTGSYCVDAGETPVTIGVKNGEAGVRYTLYRNRNGLISAEATAMGPGNIVFGTTYRNIGEYYVVAKREDTGCEKILTDRIFIGNTPVPFNIAGDACFPMGSTDNQSTVKAWNAQAGVRYKLYAVNGGYVGTLGNFYRDTVYYTGVLPKGKYVVKAEVGSCRLQAPDTVTICEILEPFTIVGDTLFCDVSDDSGVSIGLDSTQAGVKYILQRKEDLTGNYVNVEPEVSMIGTGYPQRFNGLHKTGTYRVLADNGTQLVMNGELEVKAKLSPDYRTPLSFTGNVCADSVVIIKFPTQNNAEYELYFNAVPATGYALLTGDGSVMGWTLNTAQYGTYKIKATLGDCQAVFPLDIKAGHYPDEVKLDGDTLICANVTGELYLDHYQADVVYTLYSTSGDTLGTGKVTAGRYTFTNVPPDSTYYVVAADGLCVHRSNYHTIDSMPATHLLPGFGLDYSACTVADSGWIALSGMSASQEYVIHSASLANPIEVSRMNGDITVKPLPLGEYCLTVRDTNSECPTRDSCVVLREEAPVDSIIGDFTYCGTDDSVSLRLSGVTSGAEYVLCTSDMTALDTLAAGKDRFDGPYRAGLYVLQKQRKGVFPGCIAYDTVRVYHRDEPVRNLTVEIKEGASCASDSLTFSLPLSENGVNYVLQQIKGLTISSLDTVLGTGGSVDFGKRQYVAGSYRVYAEYQGGGCGLYLDTTLQITDKPADVTITDCVDCMSGGVSLGGCAITLSNMKREVRYILYKETGDVAVDTLFGPGNKGFNPQIAGKYYVEAENLQTGCRAIMTYRPEIISRPAPTLYPVVTACSEKAEIKVTGSDGDSVKYTLYRYNVIQRGDTLRGIGSALSFGVKEIPGIYKVWAESGNGCGVWLPDSVTIYNQLDTCHLRQEGSYCFGQAGRVQLKYGCSVTGWNYYLTKGLLRSDTLVGNSGNPTLVWDTVGGSGIASGTYYLHAHNHCKDTILTSLAVTTDNVPLSQRLLGQDLFCGNEGFDIWLASSEAGVEYRLVIELRGQETQVGQAVGVTTGQQLQIVPAAGGRYAVAGRYKVYGKFKGSDCEVLVAEKYFAAGTVPETKQLVGQDVCMTNGVADSLVLSVSSRQAGINYYLYSLPGQALVDSLTSSYRPAPELQFSAQTQVGCYGAYAVNPADGCRKQLEGSYCLGYPPVIYPVENPGDTVRLCQGESYRLHLANSEAGVKYYLLQNGTEIGGPYYGPGRLETDSVFQSGIYRIKAENGCTEMMSDSVIVKVSPVPPLRLAEVRYCEGGEGKQITLNAPTLTDAEYTLILPNGTVAETLPGTGSNLVFTDLQTDSGYYHVVARNIHTGCMSRDSVQMIIDSLPLPFVLSGVPNNYICWEGTSSLELSGSQERVRYVLYRNDTVVSEKFGTGKPLTFDKIRKPGIYRVEGYFTDKYACMSPMANLVTMIQADSIRRFNLTGNKISYCYTDDAKGRLTLDGSKTGIDYELYKDGQPTGQILPGTGGGLEWNGLEGKPCDECRNDNDGYEYYVVGRDPVSGCERPMKGTYKIIEEADVHITYFHPNKDIYICQDSSVDFTVIADGCRLNYRWYQKDGAGVTRLLKDSDEPYYQIISASPGNYGKYWCEVSNSCATVEETGAMEVKVRRKMELKPNRDISVCDGTIQTVRMEAVYYATAYEWYKLGDTTLLGTEQVLELPDATAEMAGKYVCVASNECYTLTDTCELKIGLPPSLTIVKAKTDTLCKGSFYEMEVSSTDTVKWYRNGVYTGYDGLKYTIPAVDLVDEGHYSVQVVSGCFAIWEDISDLYVDDTVRVEGLTPDSLVLCEGRMANLYIITNPSDRVSYRWEYVDGGVRTIGTDANIEYGPLSASNTAYTFRVWYTNKCPQWDLQDPTKPANYRQVRIRVNERAEVEDPVREIVVCAESDRDTVIRIKHDNRPGMLYSWHFYDYQNDTLPVASNADTVCIPLLTKNSGYYFCRVNNGCEIIATNACWLRVDTVPVLQNNLPLVDTVCEGAKYELSLSSTGGSLNYDWMIRYKTGLTESLGHNFMPDYSSTGQVVINPMTPVYDSAHIWCHVYNHCDSSGVYSDTLLLRVHTYSEISISDDTLRLCGNTPGRFVVKLDKGDLPWSYSYRLESGAEIFRENLTQREDTLLLSASGTYHIVSVVDGPGCLRTHDLPSFHLLLSPRPVLGFGHSQRVCFGDTVSVDIHVEDGTGPWLVKIVDRLTGGDLASEICGPDGLLMYGRDTVVHFMADKSAVYQGNYLKDMNSSCTGLLPDTVVTVRVDTPAHISFVSGPWIVGACLEHVNLRQEVLKPFIDNQANPLPDGLGHFYVNDDDRGLDGNLQKGDLHSDTCYRVYCAYTDTLGCQVRSDEVRVCVDSLPSGEIVSSSVSCGSVAFDLKLQLRPAGRIDSLVLLQKRYKKGGTVDVAQLSFSKSQGQIPANGLFQLRVDWGDVGGADSCLVYEVQGIWDIHGCWVVPDVSQAWYRDTIWRHVDPKVDVLVRHTESDTFTINSHEENLSVGDSLQVKVVLTEGQPLWSLPALGINSIVGMDTVFWLKDTGTYWFIPRDVACDRQGDAPWYDLTLTRLDTGYFRGKVFLEGVFDENNMSMAWGNDCNWGRLRDSLRLPSSLPLLPAGLNVIDWIEVELRISYGDPIDSIARMTKPSYFVTRDSCLVLSDGHLADRWTGDTVVGIRNAHGGGANQRYVALRHRNHLGVMTNRLYRFVNNAHKANSAYIDFTDTVNIYRKNVSGGVLNNMNYHMTKKGSQGREVWLLAVGSLDSNYLVSLSDPNCVTLRDIFPSQLQGYRYDLLHDINLDGCVDWPGWNGTAQTDWLFVERNRRKYSEIRWR